MTEVRSPEFELCKHFTEMVYKRVPISEETISIIKLAVDKLSESNCERDQNLTSLCKHILEPPVYYVDVKLEKKRFVGFVKNYEDYCDKAMYVFGADRYEEVCWSNTGKPVLEEELRPFSSKEHYYHGCNAELQPQGGRHALWWLVDIEKGILKKKK